MTFAHLAANWILLLFLFQISSISAFYAEKAFAPIQEPRTGLYSGLQDVGSTVADEGQAPADGEAVVGLSEGAQSDKRRLGSALNIGRGRGQKPMTNGKRGRSDQGGEVDERFFQVYGKASGGGQPLNDEASQPSEDPYDKRMDLEEEQRQHLDRMSDVDRRNIGSAMNLIKVRKNSYFLRGIGGPPSEEEEEGRERRRLGAAMNLKKVNDRIKPRPILY